MRLAFALATFVALAVAAPVGMATDGKPSKPPKPPARSYSPYHSYSPYPKAAEKEIARLGIEADTDRTNDTIQVDEAQARDIKMVKRHEMKIPEAMEVQEADSVEKRGYGKYNPYYYYGAYHKAVEQAAEVEAGEIEPQN